MNIISRLCRKISVCRSDCTVITKLKANAIGSLCNRDGKFKSGAIESSAVVPEDVKVENDRSGGGRAGYRHRNYYKGQPCPRTISTSTDEFLHQPTSSFINSRSKASANLTGPSRMYCRCNFPAAKSSYKLHSEG